MAKKRMVLSIVFVFCVAFLTTAFEWNFDDVGKKKTEEPVAEPATEPMAEPVEQVAPETAGEPTADGDCGSALTYEGESYPTVQIGSQCWMAKNLNVGVQLKKTEGPDNNNTYEKYCYDNDAANCSSYGGLYLWEEAVEYDKTEGAQGICPDGWHIPTDAEFHILESGVASGPCDPNRTEAACEPAAAELKVGGVTEFKGILTGIKDPSGDYFSLNEETSFWTSTVGDPVGEYTTAVNHGFSTGIAVHRRIDYTTYGFPVRCIKN